MKKIISVIIATVMLLGSFSSLAADVSAEKMYIYVSAGAENGNGSEDMPFGTIEQARDKIREIKKDGQYPDGGIVVYLREGMYPVTTSIEFTEEDSGTENGPVVYRSYMEEQVTIVGGVDLNVGDFKPVTDADTVKRLNSNAKNEIIAVNLKDYGITDYGELNMFGHGTAYFDEVSRLADKVNLEQPPELFFGDEVGRLARYPNEGYIRTGTIIQTGDEIQWWSNVSAGKANHIPFEDRVYPPKPSIYATDDETTRRMKNWQNENEVWVFGYFGENWSDISLPVREINYDEGVITTEWPSPKLIKSDMNYYIYNVLGELDAPGEYYLDRDTGILYIYPTEPEGKVTFSTLNESLITLSGASNIDFKAISVKGTRKDAITMYGCDDVNFELCLISKAAANGIVLNNCINCNFTSLHIYQTGTGGIVIRTSKTGVGAEIGNDVDTNLTPQNNVVDNCEIHDYSRIAATYSPAVAFGGAGNTMRHCYIWSGDHMAISAGGNDNTIEYCEFTDLLRTADDSGAVYSGYNKHRRGIKIINNYFHDIYSSSPNGHDISMLYPDDTYDGYEIEQNLFVNIGGRVMHSNGGSTHKVKNNIAINTNHFLNFGYHGGGTHSDSYNWDRYSFQPYLKNPAYAKYENFADLNEENYLRVKGVETNNNVLWNVPTDITSKAPASDNSINPSLVVKSDPGFVDALNGDYTLRSDSVIYNTYPDFKAPDFVNMGMYTGKAKAYLGNNIAFLAGSPKVYKGFEADEINARHDAAPVIKDEVAYLPLRYITENLGGEIAYDDSTSEITVTYSAPVVLKADEYFTVNGSSLVSIEKISELFGKNVEVFENGVIIMGDDIKVSSEHTNVLAELYRRLNNE